MVEGFVRMKVAIVGSRSVTNMATVIEAIHASKFEIEEIVSGGADGVDTLAYQYAKSHIIPIHIFFPNWEAYGKKAGMIRNTAIVSYADAVVAVWDGQSKGTHNTIIKAGIAGKPCFVWVPGIGEVLPMAGGYEQNNT
jgi:hypothetical protein